MSFEGGYGNGFGAGYGGGGYAYGGGGYPGGYGVAAAPQQYVQPQFVQQQYAQPYGGQYAQPMYQYGFPQVAPVDTLQEAKDELDKYERLYKDLEQQIEPIKAEMKKAEETLRSVRDSKHRIKDIMARTEKHDKEMGELQKEEEELEKKVGTNYDALNFAVEKKNADVVALRAKLDTLEADNKRDEELISRLRMGK